MNPADSAAVAVRGASLAFHKRDSNNNNRLDPSGSISPLSSPPSSRDLSRAENSSRDIHGAYTAAAISAAAGPQRTTSLSPARTGYSIAGARGGDTITRAQLVAAANRSAESLAARTGGGGNSAALGVDPPQPQQHQQSQGFVATRLHQLSNSGGHNHHHHQQQQQGRNTSSTAAATTSAATAVAAQATYLGLAPAVGRPDAKSPSLIAATLAASRSVSPMPAVVHATRTGAGGETVKRGAGGGVMGSRASVDEGTVLPPGVVKVDSGPIAPTGSLISMFERPRDHDGIGDKPVLVKVTAPRLKVANPVERSRGSIEMTERKPKTKGNKRPPTPPAKKPIAELPLAKRPPTPPMNNPPAPAGITPAKSKARSKPPTIDQSKAVAAAGSSTSRQLNPTPTSSQATPKAPLSISQSPETQPAIPPKLPASQRRPLTPSSISSTTQPSTPVPQSTKKPLPNPLSESINLPNAVVTDRKPRPKSPPISLAITKSKTTSPVLQPSTPPPLKPLMTRSVAEVLSPKPTRPSMTSMSPISSPHLALNPVAQTASSPSPDPQKRSPTLKRPPTPPKPRRSIKNAQNRPIGRGRAQSHLDVPSLQARDLNLTAASNPAGKSASAALKEQTQPQPVRPLPARRQTVSSAPSSPQQGSGYRRRLTNASVTSLQLGNLTDAIVAGSLASTRLTPHNTGSSAMIPPSLPKRQKSPRLLQTLRQPQNPSDDESERHKKSHRPKLHKNKHVHHEGARKRWREEIRPRERKRYDALWASNRGMFLSNEMASPSTSVGSDINKDLSQFVVNIVVREIWKRSRLPVDELAEIWDLVDREGAGMLSRQEFVVGTWLVDQRLRGRKVPAKVTDSVWWSANGMTVKRSKG